MDTISSIGLVLNEHVRVYWLIFSQGVPLIAKLFLTWLLQLKWCWCVLITEMRSAEIMRGLECFHVTTHGECHDMSVS